MLISIEIDHSKFSHFAQLTHPAFLRVRNDSAPLPTTNHSIINNDNDTYATSFAKV